MVDKFLAYEAGSSSSFTSPLVLVADDAARAGDFVADADDIASGAPAERDVRKTYLSSLGTPFGSCGDPPGLRRGPFLVCHVGHGGIAPWASEDILDRTDVDASVLKRKSRFWSR